MNWWFQKVIQKIWKLSTVGLVSDQKKFSATKNSFAKRRKRVGGVSWLFARARVRARKRGFGARSVPSLDIYHPNTLLSSGNSSATSRTSRRLHHTYAAEHYITENDEPRVQSPGTLASSTCVMRRAQRAAATVDRHYTRNSRNRNSRLPLTPRRCIVVIHYVVLCYWYTWKVTDCTIQLK